MPDCPADLWLAAGPKIPLKNKPDKTNWVEKAGHLPDYIKRIAEHIKGDNPSWDDGRAIASAVNTVKRWAAGGTVHEHGGGTVSADTKAKAAAAVAEWEAKKASSKGTKLSAAEIEAVDWDEPIDMDEFALHLSAARHEAGLSSLNLSIVFNPDDHPRNLKGQFSNAIGKLKVGESVELPDGTRVFRKANSRENIANGAKPDLLYVDEKGGGGAARSAAVVALNPEDAAKVALHRSARNTVPESFGGAERHTQLAKAEKAHRKLQTQKADTLANADLKNALTTKPKPGTPDPTGDARAAGKVGDAAVPNAVADAPHNQIARLQKQLEALPQGNENRTPAQQAEAAQLRQSIKDLQGGGGGATPKGDQFKVVPTKGGSSAPEGQWTEHSSGDLEIEMPKNGPTARISQDERGGPGKWGAAVFPDAQASDSEQRTDFDSAKEAREWVQGKIESGDIQPGGADPTTAFESGLSTDRVQIDDATGDSISFSLPGGDDEQHDYMLRRASAVDDAVVTGPYHAGGKGDDEWVLSEYPLDAYDENTDQYDPESLTHHSLGTTDLAEASKKVDGLLKDRYGASAGAQPSKPVTSSGGGHQLHPVTGATRPTQPHAVWKERFDKALQEAKAQGKPDKAALDAAREAASYGGGGWTAPKGVNINPETGDHAAQVTDKQQFDAVTNAIDRFVEGGSEDFTGAADEIRDVYRAVQDPKHAVDTSQDYEAEQVLQEIVDGTEHSSHPDDKPLNEWASKKLDELLALVEQTDTAAAGGHGASAGSPKAVETQKPLVPATASAGNWKDQLKKDLGGLEKGKTIKLPDGTEIGRSGGSSMHVQQPDGSSKMETRNGFFIRHKGGRADISGFSKDPAGDVAKYVEQAPNIQTPADQPAHDAPLTGAEVGNPPKTPDAEWNKRGYAPRTDDLTPDDADLISAYLLDDAEHDPLPDWDPELAGFETALFETGQPPSIKQWEQLLRAAKRDWRDAEDPNVAKMAKAILDKYGSRIGEPKAGQ